MPLVDKPFARRAQDAPDPASVCSPVATTVHLLERIEPPLRSRLALGHVNVRSLARFTNPEVKAVSAFPMDRGTHAPHDALRPGDHRHRFDAFGNESARPPYLSRLDLHARATGHIPHLGVPATQTSAPNSIIAWLSVHDDRPLRGNIASANAQTRLGFARGEKKRRTSRDTFVSTVAALCSNAKHATAPAVYGPTPGSRRNSLGELGITPSSSLTTCRASAWRFRARA